jgi:chromosome segregation ATPase
LAKIINDKQHEQSSELGQLQQQLNDVMEQLDAKEDQ